jgi:hypothetical protein
LVAVAAATGSPPIRGGAARGTSDMILSMSERSRTSFVSSVPASSSSLPRLVSMIRVAARNASSASSLNSSSRILRVDSAAPWSIARREPAPAPIAYSWIIAWAISVSARDDCMPATTRSSAASKSFIAGLAARGEDRRLVADVGEVGAR